ncbi:CHY zinc finger protein (plasmid) [Arthrobacter sulfonylureivorans]|uniref:CHY zinc finger protein n=1 Tax=Arthrobacter sulfonylureivorans TaxID=2486855 RepID=A0ABY3WHK9_9MICC|nr:CHY zinc finger protein [Arthrobacter sulfonylureivorans]UNK47792.1 CHY zinc finger protein [Arthrobacter sulfonylureivorans]
MPRVLGSPVDDQTRCVHYRTPLDVVAIKFRCCLQYYPCHLCHQESAGHSAVQWPADEHHITAVHCGVCNSELSIRDYLAVNGCPRCAAEFNPGCRLHSQLYFITETRQENA